VFIARATMATAAKDPYLVNEVALFQCIFVGGQR
jgi:hypothetical protein